MGLSSEQVLITSDELDLFVEMLRNTAGDFALSSGVFNRGDELFMERYIAWFKSNGHAYIDTSIDARAPLPLAQELIASGTNWTAYIPRVGLRRCVQSGPTGWIKTEQGNDVPQLHLGDQNTRISFGPHLNWRHELTLRSWRTEDYQGKEYVNEMGRLQVPYSNLGALVVFKYVDAKHVEEQPHRLRLSADRGEIEYTPMRILPDHR